MAAPEAGGPPLTATLHGCSASTSEDSWTDSEVDSSCSGQPIHLWQFLKELLLKPHSYGRFIRWLNKEKGEPGALQGATGRGRENRQGGGCAGACRPPPGPRPQAQGRAGGWAEGRSGPQRCPECQTRAPTGLARSLRAFTSAPASRPSSVLFRTPGSTQCPGHTKGFKLG